MSDIYLDKTGLAYFWSKIKAWCNSLFALDSNVVHKTGDELVQGIKEFKNSYDDTSDSSMADSSHSIVLRTTRYRKGTNFSTLSYNDFINIVFQDNAGNLINHDGRMASIDYCADSNGAYYLDIICFKNSLSEPNDHSAVRVGYNSAGIKFTSIEGTLYCQDGVTAYNNYRTRNNSLVKGTTPSSSVYSYLHFYDRNGNTWQANGIGLIENLVDTGNKVMTYIGACKNEANSTTMATVRAVYDTTNNDAYGTAPTPSNAADSSDKIATTYWVRNATGNTSLNAANVTGVVAVAHGGTGSSTKNFVDLSTNQTAIGGQKTFLDNTIIRSSWPHYSVFQTDYTYGGTLPSTNIYSGMLVYDSISTMLGCVEHVLSTGGNSFVTIWARGINQNITTGVSVTHDSGNGRIFRPNGDNILSLGHSANRWKNIYAASATINTSDERLKAGISEVPDAVLDAWEGVGFRQFKFIDAVEEKGSSARLHVGLVAQDIGRTFAGRGLSAADYGLYCRDEWEASSALVAGDGETVVQEASAAGDRYSLRYEEALCMEAAYMRRENARLKKRVFDLEDRLAALELRLGSE